MTTFTLSDSLQLLIDSRLDAIDRMLLGRMTRADRVAITTEVESQIYELLSIRDQSTLTREDVLAVLGRLDPPEAYIPDDLEEATLPRRVRPIASLAAPVDSASSAEVLARRRATLGLILSLSGLATIVLGAASIVALAMAGLFGNSIVLYFASALMVLLTSIGLSVAGFVYSIIGRRGGAMAVLGIISACLAGVLCLVCGVMSLML